MGDNTILVEEAKIQVGNWRAYYADTYNAYPQKDGQQSRPPIHPDENDTYRGFWVSFKDLAELKEIMEKINVGAQPDKTKAGIRIYLANKNAEPGETTSKDMHVLIVPVDANGKDVLELPSASNNAAAVSTILDFSSPCPVNCDVTSPLYK